MDEICRNLDIPDVDALWTYANEKGIHGHFKQMLLDVATNNETSFFRDPKLYKSFEKNILPQWIEDNPGNTFLRIWSLACSFGQEPYTLAMLLDEYSEKNVKMPNYEIWATDISDEARNRTKEGRYSQLEVQRGLPATKLTKYFTKKEDEHWYVKAELKTRVSVDKVNLLDLYGVKGKFDFVFCRNVLIYQTEERKREIIERLTQYISDSGYLILGSSESLLGVSDRFEQKIIDGAVFFKKKA